MTKIKICGIRSQKDICFINELKPDYVGFVFAKSKRRVSMEEARVLIKNLSPSIKRVGVFVDEDPIIVEKIAETLNLDVIQFHGEETKEYIEKFKSYEVWKAVKITSEDSLEKLKEKYCDKFLLDNTIPGSGESFDWKLVEGKLNGSNIMLAGGLTSVNVKQGINALKPFGVDVSSGVETNGAKNYEKIKEFILKVRELI